MKYFLTILSFFSCIEWSFDSSPWWEMSMEVRSRLNFILESTCYLLQRTSFSKVQFVPITDNLFVVRFIFKQKSPAVQTSIPRGGGTGAEFIFIEMKLFIVNPKRCAKLLMALSDKSVSFSFLNTDIKRVLSILALNLMRILIRR